MHGLSLDGIQALADGVYLKLQIIMEDLGFTLPNRCRLQRWLQQIASKSAVLGLSPVVIRIMQDFAMSRGMLRRENRWQRWWWDFHKHSVSIRRGRGDGGLANIAKDIELDGKSGSNAVYPPPLLFSAAMMLWILLLNLQYHSSGGDRYLLPAMTVAAGTGLLFGQLIGLDIPTSFLCALPWCVYFVSLVSDVCHFYVRSRHRTPSANARRLPLNQTKVLCGEHGSVRAKAAVSEKKHAVTM